MPMLCKVDGEYSILVLGVKGTCVIHPICKIKVCFGSYSVIIGLEIWRLLAKWF